MSEATTPTETRREGARQSARKREPRSRRDDRRKQDWRESARFWFWAIIITLILRAFIIEPYRIPTPSMERTLLVGDFLFVSKLHYGPRTPNTLGVPFTGIYLRGLTFPQTRLPGFSGVQRGDVAVFNYPPDTGPIERRTPYIKRLVAVPGDRVLILDKALYINDERQPLDRHQMQWWRVEPAEGQLLTPAAVQREGATLVATLQQPRPSYLVEATAAQAASLLALQSVGDVEAYVLPEGQYTQGMFPPDRGFNRDNYGPITVPGRGQTVELNAGNWAMYRDIINRFEGRSAQMTDEGVVIDGVIVTEYTFEKDYYFALGDNRDNSEDSRFWGVVPHDHLVGKAVLVFFSLDFENRFLGFIPAPRLRGLSPIR